MNYKEMKIMHGMGGLELSSTQRLSGEIKDSDNNGQCKPFCVSAEHSTYFTARSSRARRSAASCSTGFSFCR